MTNNPDDTKILNKRNTSAVEQSLAALSAKVYEQQILIDKLQTTIASCIEKLGAVEKVVMLQRVALAGNGPSVK